MVNMTGVANMATDNGFNHWPSRGRKCRKMIYGDPVGLGINPRLLEDKSLWLDAGAGHPHFITVSAIAVMTLTICNRSRLARIRPGEFGISMCSESG